MPLTISDEVFQQAGLTEGEARVEFACRLYAAGRMTLHAAGKLASLSRPLMEEALFQRNIPVYQVTLEGLRQDVENLRRAGV